jgi:ADP-heptose:LPS heptosyltransferase
MHILETYALLSGAKINKCFIHEDPIDIPSSKYITFHPYSPKGNSKQYDHWTTILDLLKNTKSFDYEIIQIGEENDTKYNVNNKYLGQTTFNSLATLIKKSSLHLGFDSFPVHLASYYNIKIVALYSYYASTCGPYFSDQNKIRLLEPSFDKIKPTFNHNDPYRLINNIDPILVYRSVLDLLEIKYEN